MVRSKSTTNGVSRAGATKRRGTEDASHHEAVALLFGVLAEATRLRILQELERGPSTVSHIVATLQIKQANASKQLGIMYRAGLLDRAKEGNQVRYRIRMPLVSKLCELVCGELHRDAVERARLLGGA